jgi:molybdopterin molybdotransferase
MLSVEEAQKIILAEVHPLEAESVPLLLSLGRYLACDIVSAIDDPPWNRSAMDGYAVISKDTKQAFRDAPCTLTVIEKIPAGTIPQKKVISGTASKIMTGAPLPEGADAVIKIEDTTQKDTSVLVYSTAEKGDFIRYRGEVVRQGACVLQKGVLIRAYEIALMATIGISQAFVFRRPRVAILSTGDELVDLHEQKKPHQIYNSNGYGLSAQVVAAGGIPIMLGIAKDTREDLKAKLSLVSDADFIVISGGVSVGDYDFVKEVIADLGGTVQFWKVAMKPGKPLAFGRIAGKPIFGLPGNPVSAMVTFDQFVRPALLAVQGSVNPLRATIYATLTENIQKEPGRCHFVRGTLTCENGEYEVFPTWDQDSSNIVSLVKANAYIVLPEVSGDVQAGSKVLVQTLAIS